jgi:hypothetical protein
LLGFEFETNLPASNLGRALDQGGKPHETAQETRLRKFLTGQAYADEEIHNFSGEGFSAVADHGPVSSAIEQARTRINFEMSRATLPDGTAKQYIGDQNAIDPRPGIVEYKTAAFDTSQPQGIEEFARTISRLATHMNNIYNQILSAGAANSPLSSTNWLVGVPLLADWNAFANRYNIPLNVMQEQRDNIMEKINQQIYPQITVGILPKNIPTLFKKTKEAGLTRGQDPNLSQLSEERSQLRVTHAEKVARKALQDLSNVTVTPDTEGYVTLIAQYVLGSLADAVDHFEITKNLPIFLSKAHLTGAQQTIANGNARPAGWSLEARERLTSKLWKYAAEYFNKTPHGMRVDRDTQGGFTKANALHILTNDQGDDPFIVATGTRTVGLDDHRDPQNNLRPNQEIPLEFRALENLVSPDQLNAWSNKIMFLITTQVNPL